MERGIVSAVNGRRARVKRPDGYVTGWLFMANSVVNITVGDVVFYAPFGNDGLILHAIPDEVDGFAPLTMGVTNGDAHDHSGGDGAQIAYSSLSGRPTLGTAASQDSSAFATAAQGTKADAALPLSGGSLTGDIDIGGNTVWHAGNLHNSSALCDLYLYGSSTAGNPQYSAQYSEYTRVGDQVDVSFRFVLTSLGGMDGGVRIGNLPFEADSTSSASATALNVSNITRTNLRAVMALVQAGSTYASLRIMYESSGTMVEGILAASHMANDSMIVGIISYKAA